MSVLTPIVGEVPVGFSSLWSLANLPEPGTPIKVFVPARGGLRISQTGSATPAPDEFRLDGQTITLGVALLDFLHDDHPLVDYWTTQFFQTGTALILSLVDDLSLGQADATQVADILTNVLDDLALRGWLVSVTPYTVTAGTATYDLALNAVSLLAVLGDDTQLSPTRELSLEMLDADWRARRGRPSALVRDFENDRAFRVWPTPDVTSKAAGANALGDGFPTGALHVLTLDRRDPIPEWLALPVALLVLAREFVRESDHRDVAFASTCQALADVLLELIAR